MLITILDADTEAQIKITESEDYDDDFIDITISGKKAVIKTTELLKAVNAFIKK